MAKRPKTGRSRLMGMGSMAGYLRDRRIGIKLGFIMFVPTLATVIVGANGLVSQISTANAADRARSLATLSTDAGTLVQALQEERADAALVLGYLQNNNNKSAVSAAIKDYHDKQNETLKAQNDYTQQASAASGLPDSFVTNLSNIASKLSSLPGLRNQITDSNAVSGMPLSIGIEQYDVLISRLLAVRDASAQLTGDPNLSYELRAAAALSQAKEYVNLERTVGLGALLDGSMSGEQKNSFIAAITGQDQAVRAFEVVATPAQDALFHQTVTGDPLKASTDYETELRGADGTRMPQGLTPDAWNKAMNQRSTLFRHVENEIDNQTVEDAQTLHDNVERQIIIAVGLLFGVVLIAMLIAWFVARSMNRSLRELKHGALTVARQGLPQAVARLRDPALATQLSPQQMAVQIAEPLPVRSKDEFGEVTEAFNAVHLEAVRTAAEQAALRSSVATMFVNLARRSQILVDRLIGHLDRLERGEENPDRLAELFQLDHLATRMRRNDENLLVLAGADSTRVQREPAPLVDVLRAAQSEVEHYTRIEFGTIDRDLEIAAHAVNDLVHLIAELLDNATAFSPPDSPVLVEARRFGDRAVLYVEDKGIGISGEQLADLNEKLAEPPLVDVAVSRMMGLVVVARLANRHGVEVKLRPAPDRGTIADVLLPAPVLVSRTVGYRGVPPVAGVDRQAISADVQPPTQTRSPFAPPLALESGPSADYARPAATAGSVGAPNGNGAYAPAGLGGFAAAAEQFGANRPTFMGPGVTSRALPSWSDLTGAGSGGGRTGTNGRPAGPQAYAGFGGGQARPPAPPLPQRRPDAPTPPPGPGVEDTGGRSSIPRQRPPRPLITPIEPIDDLPLDDVPDAELVDDPFSPEPAVEADDAVVTYVEERGAPTAAPPSWPPVAPAPTPADAGRSPSPAGRVEGLDMTTEIPRYRDLDLGGGVRDDRPVDAPSQFGGATVGTPVDELRAASSAPPYPGAAAPPQVMPFADETMELPIFRELESAWFATVTPGPGGAGAASAPEVARSTDTGEQPVHDYGWSSVDAGGWRDREPAETTTGGTMAGSARSDRPVEQEWRTSADPGWAAAAAASEPADGGTTTGGLPRRVPLAQLVPGSVTRDSSSQSRRSPEAVRGLLSAYHRGVQRGRQASGDESMEAPESMTTGPNTPGGKERET